LGNSSFPWINSTYRWVYDTNRIVDGVYQIKVNFTDSKNHTWHGVSKAFIIDNIPDIPEPLILYPFDGDTLTGEAEIISKVWDDENNLYKVVLSYRNATINWTKINGTKEIGEDVYITKWDTRSLNETTPYSIRVFAEDRNKYSETHYITVYISHER
jgi:hypothetical protein